jgi:hypothetical protein
MDRGRLTTPADRAGAPLVAIVNQAFVRAYSKDREAVGRRIRLSNEEREIVGVVGSVRQRSAGFLVSGMTKGPLTEPPIVYIPAAQAARLFGVHVWFQPVWIVRSTSMRVAGPAIARAIAAADPLLPISEPQSMSDVMAKPTSQQRLLMTLIGLLAAAATLLAAIGMHGLTTQIVAERTREFGIRIALGATARRTAGSVAMSGLTLSILGAVIGGGLSIPAVRLVQTFLWGVGANDPWTYAGVAGILLVVSAVASLLPAMKIARLDPAQALK